MKNGIKWENKRDTEKVCGTSRICRTDTNVDMNVNSIRNHIHISHFSEQTQHINEVAVSKCARIKTVEKVFAARSILKI